MNNAHSPKLIVLYSSVIVPKISVDLTIDMNVSRVEISEIFVRNPIIASKGSSRLCWFSIGSRIMRHFLVICSRMPDAVK